MNVALASTKEKHDCLQKIRIKVTRSAITIYLMVHRSHFYTCLLLVLRCSTLLGRALVTPIYVVPVNFVCLSVGLYIHNTIIYKCNTNLRRMYVL